MSTPSYDAIVLGAGGVGSAALWRLAKRGVRVLGIDRFSPPHNQGSSHGHTRMIRQAYFEHPDYVPLVKRAYELWAELEVISGRRLFEPTGLIEVGPADGVVVPGVLRAAREHHLAVESLAPAAARERWPAFAIDDDQAVVFEPTAGTLYVEDGVRACLDEAQKLGAEMLPNTVVNGWRTDGAGLVVETSAGAFACDRLVVTAGPWASGLLQALGVKLQLRRQSLFWFAAPADHTRDRMPPFLFEESDGAFYGFPAFDAQGVKVGDHGRGQPLDRPEALDRTVDAADERRLRTFLARRLPGVGPAINDHATCYYTMSPDEHFVVDRLPTDNRISLAAGLSGHGFKFTPVLGEALANLAIDGRTALPIGFLSAARFDS